MNTTIDLIGQLVDLDCLISRMKEQYSWSAGTFLASCAWTSGFKMAIIAAPFVDVESFMRTCRFAWSELGKRMPKSSNTWNDFSASSKKNPGPASVLKLMWRWTACFLIYSKRWDFLSKTRGIFLSTPLFPLPLARGFLHRMQMRSRHGEGGSAKATGLW